MINKIIAIHGVMDSIIENLSFKVLFLLSFVFSICYAMISSYVYKIFESKVAALGIAIEEKFINGYMKIFTIFLKIVYVQCFGTAISATAILFLDTDNTVNTLQSFLHPIDEYHKEISLYLLLFKIINLLLFIALGLYLPSLFSTSMILLRTSFEKSIMNNVNLSNAFANRVNFKYSKMTTVNFKGASLRFASFHGSHFETVDFEDADLTSCNFTKSNVEDLVKVNFKNAIIDGAYYKEGDMINHISTIPGFIN